MHFSSCKPPRPKTKPKSTSRVNYNDSDSPLLPGLPADISKYCLSLVPRSNLPSMARVSKRWRSFIQSKEFICIRKTAGTLEEWLCALTVDSDRKEIRWEVMTSAGHKRQVLPRMPGPLRTGCEVVALQGKILVLGGYTVIKGIQSASADVYRYDSCLNSWSKLANMNVPRYDFACTELNGLVYVIGGQGTDNDNLSVVEVYNPDTNKWAIVKSLRRPRWDCFATSFNGKIYVMGGRSSFTIGNSRVISIYDPTINDWCEVKNGCVMVTAHAVLGDKLYCMEWKNQRKLAIFNPEDCSWKMVAVPLTGGSSVGFRFGVMGDKLFLFSEEKESGYVTLTYDPNAGAGSEWKTSHIKPSGSCLCAVTIKA